MKGSLSKVGTLLIVDDEADLRSALAEELSDKFFSVITAQNGKEALDIARTKQIDCLVTDFNMPVMNGLQLIEAFIHEFPGVPTILITGYAHDKEVIHAIEMGLFDFLEKPFQMHVLVNRIQNALLLPKLEKLILAVAAVEFPELNLDHFLTSSFEERARVIHGLEGLISTRFLARRERKIS